MKEGKKGKGRNEEDGPIDFVKVVREQLNSCIKPLEEGSPVSAALKLQQLIWAIDDYLKENA